MLILMRNTDKIDITEDVVIVSKPTKGIIRETRGYEKPESKAQNGKNSC